MLGPSLVVNILQTPTLGAARTCDEPGSGEEVCPLGFATLDWAAGLNSALGVCWLEGLGPPPSSRRQRCSVVNSWNAVVKGCGWGMLGCAG